MSEQTFLWPDSLPCHSTDLEKISPRVESCAIHKIPTLDSLGNESEETLMLPDVLDNTTFDLFP